MRGPRLQWTTGSKECARVWVSIGCFTCIILYLHQTTISREDGSLIKRASLKLISRRRCTSDCRKRASKLRDRGTAEEAFDITLRITVERFFMQTKDITGTYECELNPMQLSRVSQYIVTYYG